MAVSPLSVPPTVREHLALAETLRSLNSASRAGRLSILVGERVGITAREEFVQCFLVAILHAVIEELRLSSTYNVFLRIRVQHTAPNTFILSIPFSSRLEVNSRKVAMATE